MKTQSLKIKRYSKILFGLMAIIAFSLVTGRESTLAAQTRTSSEDISVSQSRLTIEWSAGEIEWQMAENGSIPHIDGFETTNRPGTAQLPIRSVPFAIPADTKVEFTVSTAKAIQLKIGNKLAIAPKPAGVLRDTENNVIGGDYQQIPRDETQHHPVVAVEEIGTMGGVRLGRAVFHPITFEDGALNFVSSTSIQIEFRSTRAVPSLKLPLTQGPMADILSQEVVNPDHLIPSQPAMPHKRLMQGPATATAVIEVAGEGMVHVSHQQLVDSGVDLNLLDPTTLQLSQAGTLLPLQWMGDSDQTFEAGEALRFYAPHLNSRWSNTGRFLLKSGDSPRLEMGSRSGASSEPQAPLWKREVVEQNKIYSSDCLCGQLNFGRDGDRWMWQSLSRPGTPSQMVEATISQPDTSQPATLTISMLGRTRLEHHVAVRLNGTDLGTLRWNGQELHTETLWIPADVIQANNQVEMTLVDSEIEIDAVWLDSLQFDYATGSSAIDQQEKLLGVHQASGYTHPIQPNSNPTLYDVTTPQSPFILSSPTISDTSISWGDEGQTGSTYALVPADGFLSPVSITTSEGLNMDSTSTAEILIIAPDEFINSGALTPLINLRLDQGWHVGGEAVEDIYTAFGEGEPRPEAIRDYLAWAYHNWESQPEMVLLVGDGSTDPKQHLASSPVTRIPPFLATVDSWMGETAVDNQFVTVDGDDNLPDMMIGRLPVNSSAELAQLVDKIVRYETTEIDSIWNRKTIWTADNAGSSRMFEEFSEELKGYFIKSPFFGQRLYLDSAGANLDQLPRSVTQSWQNGAGLVVYTGHASRHQWAAERLFHIEDVASLGNQEKLPFVMHLSCLTGSFHSSSLTALDEQLLNQPDGGAIGVWGSSGLGVATGHHHLAAGALDVLYSHEAPLLGSASMAGKVRLATRGAEHGIMLDTFNLLGDPATRFNVELLESGEHAAFLPAVNR